MQFEFSRLVSKNSQISNFMKIRPVGTEMFHAGDRYDAFRNVANVSKANQLMQHEKTIIVPPPPPFIRTIHINALCGQNAELFNVTPCGTQIKH